LALISKKITLTRTRMLDFLEKFSVNPGEECLTLYLPPHLPSTELENLLKEAPAPEEIYNRLLEIAVRSNTGSVIFWENHRKYLIVPPVPIAEKSAIRSLDTAPLRSLISREYLMGLVLVRLGSYAIGAPLRTPPRQTDRVVPYPCLRSRPRATGTLCKVDGLYSLWRRPHHDSFAAKVLPAAGKTR
jgi:hypothetical protein